MNATMHIAALLKQTMGLDPATVGSSLIERAIDERMAALCIRDHGNYLLALQGNAEEMQQLIDHVIVPETWFFRDREAISAVADLAGSQLATDPAHPVRILSIPCSTGEEPYSIVMAMLDKGIPAKRFHVDAIDICTRSLRIAQVARYGSNSFRGKQLAYRNRHFSKVGVDHVLSDAVRQQVRFRQGNLLAGNFLLHEQPYDFVFCRNVLIYFDRTVQEQAVRVLQRLLAPEGTLFVGPSEAGILLRQNAAAAGIPLAFAFRHKPALSQTKKPALLKTVVTLPSVHTPPAKVQATSIKPAISPKQPVPITATMLMQEALHCANQGDYARARILCKQHEGLVGPSASGFYLLGLISDADQDVQAASQLYRKAIYLQPDHAEALTQLAALLHAQGDAANAQRMYLRAQRAREQTHE